jgi:hypothetical protein
MVIPCFHASRFDSDAFNTESSASDGSGLISAAEVVEDVVNLNILFALTMSIDERDARS